MGSSDCGVVPVARHLVHILGHIPGPLSATTNIFCTTMTEEKRRSQSKKSSTRSSSSNMKLQKSFDGSKDYSNSSSKTHSKSNPRASSKGEEQLRKSRASTSSLESNSLSVPKQKHKLSKLEEGDHVYKPEGATEGAETYAYADDFEYEDEFELEDDLDEDVKYVHEKNYEDGRNGLLANVSSFEQMHGGTSTSMGQSQERKLPLMEETPLLNRLASRQGSRTTDKSAVKPVECEGKVSRISSAELRIDFTSTSDVNQSALAQADERYRKLSDLIMIESVTYVILDRPPINDYDLYMELFGQSGKSVSSTQTGDEDLDEETQTEKAEIETKWTQHPPYDSCGWGTDGSTHVDANSQKEIYMEIFRENHLQNPRLKRFLETATQVVIDLISARRKLTTQVEMKNNSAYAFSMGYNTFELGPLAQESRVTTVSFNPNEPHLILVGFFVEKSPAEDILKRTLLVEYFLENDQPPKRLFLSEGEVACSSYTNDNTTLVAGVSDGVVQVYDLLEPSSVFPFSLPWPDSPNNIALRSPAYDSSFLSCTLSNGTPHPIVDVQVMEREVEYSCQVASLDQSGSVSLWIVLRDSQGRQGVRPHSQLSLQLLALIRPDPFVMRSTSQPTPLLANCLVIRTNPQLFLVGTDAGFLCGLSRTMMFSHKGPRLLDSNLSVHGEVLCAKISPFESSTILAGFSTGSLSVYNVGHPNPTAVLTPPASSQKPVISVEWSPISPSVLYSIHGHTRLLVWNLSKGRSPQAVHDLSQHTMSQVVLTRIWLQKSSNTYSKGIAYMALGLSSGTVEVHALEAAKNEK